MAETNTHDSAIDDRAHAAVANLRSHVSTRQIPESRRVGGATRRRAVFAIASIAIVVGGLVVIGERVSEPTEVAPATAPASHWAVTALPAGWVPIEVEGPAATSSASPEWFKPTSLYGSGAPDGPVIRLSDSDDPTSMSGITVVDEQTASGRRTVFATDSGGNRFLFVELDTGWVEVESRDVEDSVLLDLAGSITTSDDAPPQIVPTALPASMSPLGTGRFYELAPVLWGGVVRQGTTPGLVVIGYASADGTSYLSLASGPAFPSEFATLGLNPPKLVADSDGSTPRWIAKGLSGDADATTLVWEQDGQIFYLTSVAGSDGALDEIDDEQLLTIAASVQPINASEWDELKRSATSP